jgi:hypothetical protein
LRRALKGRLCATGNCLANLATQHNTTTSILVTATINEGKMYIRCDVVIYITATKNGAYNKTSHLQSIQWQESRAKYSIEKTTTL